MDHASIIHRAQSLKPRLFSFHTTHQSDCPQCWRPYDETELDDTFLWRKCSCGLWYRRVVKDPMLHHRGPDQHWNPPLDKYTDRLNALQLGARRVHVASAPFELGDGVWMEVSRNSALRPPDSNHSIVSIRSDTLKMYCDRSLDSIVFLESLNKTAFPTALFQDAARLLVPGGLLVIGYEPDIWKIKSTHACRIGITTADTITQMIRRVTDRFSLVEKSPHEGWIVFRFD